MAFSLGGMFSSSKGSSESTGTVDTSKWTPEQRELERQLIEYLTPHIGLGADVYPGAYMSGPTDWWGLGGASTTPTAPGATGGFQQVPLAPGNLGGGPFPMPQAPGTTGGFQQVPLAPGNLTDDVIRRLQPWSGYSTAQETFSAPKPVAPTIKPMEQMSWSELISNYGIDSGTQDRARATAKKRKHYSPNEALQDYIRGNQLKPKAQVDYEQALARWEHERAAWDHSRPPTPRELALTDQLPGTQGPDPILRQLINDAVNQSGSFAAWARVNNPEEWAKRVAERSDIRQQILAPSREREDSLMRSKMAAMGLSHSSDVLARQGELYHTRELEDQQFANQMYDRYEQLGLEATPQMISASLAISQRMDELKQRGLEAKYSEWLRTQEEYSPWLDAMMKMLGLQGVNVGFSTATEKGQGTSWGVSGKTSGGASDLASLASMFSA